MTDAFQIVHTETASTDFYNLKNKAAGARRYGYVAKLIKYTESTGKVTFRGDYQTTLNGSRYQSSKHSNWFATVAEARTALDKTILGAMKRYAKLSQDPASKIEHRPAVAA
jgi:hypothetical protein